MEGDESVPWVASSNRVVDSGQHCIMKLMIDWDVYSLNLRCLQVIKLTAGNSCGTQMSSGIPV